ncbi:hypothetical protein SSZBM1_36 [Synechococcus phage S-SZBM1]|uniref:Uncharacterized protein n=1 Tax=Synechococcus phage S-SZBM1 TaxID=2926475 RepID=A0AC61TSE6_9CAUD|nr:hypothetical protein PP650_gp036 [Synechococcus phage S-SZBM1]UNH61153.1 hypothetical protein SSZBM1_36 [Synechococcus phage S-SZBM1]
MKYHKNVNLWYEIKEQAIQEYLQSLPQNNKDNNKNV